MQQANGGGPNLADQMNQLAVQRNQAAAASLLGGMKGISPMASMRAISSAQSQAGADAAGQAALARMQQQMEAQRLLGINTLGMTGIGANYKSNAQGVNAQTAAQNAQSNSKLFGSILSGAAGALTGGAALGAGGAAAGGGGMNPAAMALGGRDFNENLGGYNFAQGGQVPGGGQSWLAQAAMQMQGGGMVPGRAQVAGDSPRNDTVPAALSPGEIVLPRSVAQHPDAAQAAYDFVAALKARGGR